MGKVILKTSLVTLGVLLSMIAIVYLLMLAFAPMQVGDFYSDLGNNKMAIGFYEKCFEKDDDNNNLEKVLNCSIALKDDERIILYADKFLSRAKDGKIKCKLAKYYYVAGEMSVSLYKTKGVEKAVQNALLHVSGYGELNPLEVLISRGAEKEDIDLLEGVQKALTAFKDNGYSTLNKDGKARLDTDIENLAKLIEIIKSK